MRRVLRSSTAAPSRLRAWARVRRLGLATLLLGGACGPALAEQVHLVQLSDQAAAACAKQRSRCTASQACAEDVQAAVQAIQRAQLARARGQLDGPAENEASARAASARTTCAGGRTR